MQSLKKQCTTASKKGKPKSSTTQSTSKDPQSIAAKVYIERYKKKSCQLSFKSLNNLHGTFL